MTSSARKKMKIVLRIKGEAYRQTVVRQANGEAEQIIAEAEGYRTQVTERAQGEADRFLAILEEYQLAKEVTRDRLYITAMETVSAICRKSFG